MVRLVAMPLAAAVPLQVTAAGPGPWQFDPAIAVFTAVLAAGYAAGWYRLRRRAAPWPAIRAVPFGVGLLATLLLTMAWPGADARWMLWTYTAQVTLLLVVVPALLVFGHPLSLLALNLPATAAGRLAAIRRAAPVRLLTSAAVTPVYVPVILAGLFFTHLLPATLGSRGALQATQVALLVLGMLIALPLAGEDRDQTSVFLAAGIFIGFIELFLDAVPGIVLRLTTHPVALRYFEGLHRSRAAMMADQHRAGAILWFMAEIVDLPFLAIMVVQWIRLDRREAARIDRELDEVAVAAAPRATGTAGTAGSDHTGAIGTDDRYTRPWWETDAEVFGDRRAVAYGQVRTDPPAADGA